MPWRWCREECRTQSMQDTFTPPDIHAPQTHPDPLPKTYLLSNGFIKMRTLCDPSCHTRKKGQARNSVVRTELRMVSDCHATQTSSHKLTWTSLVSAAEQCLTSRLGCHQHRTANVPQGKSKRSPNNSLAVPMQALPAHTTNQPHHPLKVWQRRCESNSTEVLVSKTPLPTHYRQLVPHSFADNCLQPSTVDRI